MSPPGSATPRAADVLPAAHRRRDALAWWQYGLTFVAAPVAVVVWWGWEAIRAAPATPHYAPAPVASAHALWEADCGACHASSAPLDASNWAALTTGHTHAGDAQCRLCHQGPDHHANEKPADVPACTACHREHRGREAALARPGDGRCVTCHADLTHHLAQGKTTSFANVRRFDGNREHHPEFRVLRDKAPDPGKLQFDHRLHMAEGMRQAPESRPFTLAQVDARYRTQYRRDVPEGDGQAVQLGCASCHRLDGGDGRVDPAALQGLPRAAVLPARGPGVAMLPVTYEVHCQGCHPLTVERRDPDDARSGLLAVPHRLQPAEVHDFLEGHYTEQYLAGHGPQALRPLRPLPGEDPEAAARREEARQDIAGRVARAERVLYLGKQTCGECHSYQASPGEPAPDQLARLRIEPTGVPQVWFEHAAFDHTAHRFLDCLACHAGASTSRASRDVLLPGIATCLECHNAASRAAARHDCAECHPYHNGDRPLQGRGAAARDPAGHAADSSHLRAATPGPAGQKPP
jgi:predicted CXXCH cytochrome family protein